jgi:hypothetical protein
MLTGHIPAADRDFADTCGRYLGYHERRRSADKPRPGALAIVSGRTKTEGLTIMAVNTLTRRITLLVGGVAIVGMGTLSACSSTTKEEAPATSKTSTSSAPSANSSAPAAPNEKGMSPKDPNSFAPTVKAPPAPTAEPG